MKRCVRHIYLIGVLLASVGVVGCGKQAQQQPTVPAPPPIQTQTRVFDDKTNTWTTKEELARREAQQPPQVSTARPDKNTPESSYIKLDDAATLALAYASLSGQPVNENLIAAFLSEEYAKTTDGFKKQDLMNSIKPQINTKLEAAKKSKYYVVEIEYTLGHYDFQKKIFPIDGFDSKSELRMGGLGFAGGGNGMEHYGVKFSNAEAFSGMEVDDTTVARKMEEKISNKQGIGGKAKVYLFAQSVENKTYPKVIFEIVKMDFFDNNQKLLGHG